MLWKILACLTLLLVFVCIVIVSMFALPQSVTVQKYSLYRAASQVSFIVFLPVALQSVQQGPTDMGFFGPMPMLVNKHIPISDISVNITYMYQLKVVIKYLR